MYRFHSDTAAAGQSRLVIPASSSRADALVAQNNHQPSCATGRAPFAHRPYLAVDDTPFTAGDSDDQTSAADESTLKMGVCWPKQAHHTSQMDRVCMRGEQFEVVQAPAKP